MNRWMPTLAAAACATGLATAAAAQPENPGPYQTGVWENPPGAPIPLPAGIYYPVNAPCPGAPVVLSHGFGESGHYKVRIAQLLASYGLVAVLPSFPSLLSSPTPAEGQLVNQLLDWTVAQSNAPTPIAGKVDGSVYGVAGHSNGGVVYYAAATNPKIQAIVGWDAVAALSEASGFHGASLHLVADGSQCGGGSSMAYDLAPAPKALGRVAGASHCDFNDPASPFCSPVCGAPPWNGGAANMIARYSVAWLVCLLGHDPSMQQWVDFNGAPAGLSNASQMGSVACRPADACGGGPIDPPGGTGGTAGGGTAGTTGEAGGPTTGSGGTAGTPSGPPTTGGCTTDPDCNGCDGCYAFCVCNTGAVEQCVEVCGSDPEPSGGAAAPSTDEPSAEAGGCGCRLGARAPTPGWPAAMLLVLAFALRRNRRRVGNRAGAHADAHYFRDGPLLRVVR